MPDEKKEEEIVTPERFGISGYKPFFHCPKCNSSVIHLDPDYKKNNTAISLDDKKEIFKYALKCGNCEHKDLLENFLATNEPPWKVPPKNPNPYGTAPFKKWRNRFGSNERRTKTNLTW